MRTLTTLGLVLFLGSGAHAQQTLFKDEAIDLKESAVLHDSKTLIVPYYTLLASANGGMWVSGGNARLHAKFFVLGIDKATMQELSARLQDDLVTRLRGIGFTVLTYNDVKDHDVMKGADRRTPDKDPKYDGMNTTKDRGGDANFVIATFNDESNIKPALQGAHWGLRGIAKDKDAVLMVPELWYEIPIAVGKGEEGYTDKAEISVLPGMKLHRANVVFINQKARGGTVQIKYNHKVSDDVGTVVKGASDDFSFGEFKRGSQDFTVTLDKEKFKAGVMRGGLAFNDVIIAQVKKEQLTK
ncbi:MAG: hypothetical protein JWM95_2769 [Gemmatimonadetes bacterium]|nr:hypothetical protein [Gemmatimonadota bacterium]